MVVSKAGHWRTIRRSLLRSWRWILDWTIDLVIWMIVRPQKGMIPPVKDELLLLSATELARRIRTRQVSSESAVLSYIARIQTVNPLINAVVDERYSDALQEARQVDSYLESSGKSPSDLENEQPLLGVPFTVKGNMACKGLVLDAGMLCRQGKIADSDSEVVVRMRSAGAIPLALTNLPEMAMSFSCHNWIYGSTKNPFDLSMIPGGSSGGEAALLTSSGSALGLGNDLLGSLRIPACLTGIFSHKPTGGIVPTEGIYPYLEEALKDVACIGPMSKHAEDLRVAMKVLTDSKNNKLQMGKKVDLQRVIIYFSEECFESPLVPRVDPEVKLAVIKALRHMERLSGKSASEIRLSQMAHCCWIFASLTSHKVKRRLRSFLSDKKEQEVEVIPEFLKAAICSSQHTFFPMLFCVMETMVPKKDSDLYRSYQNMHDAAKKKLANALDDQDAVWIIPSFPQSSLHHLESITKYHVLNYFALFNVLGLPVTQVPMGRGRNDFPIGIQVVGGKYNDHLTIAVAEELEKAFGGWVRPDVEQHASIG